MQWWPARKAESRETQVLYKSCPDGGIPLCLDAPPQEDATSSEDDLGAKGYASQAPSAASRGHETRHSHVSYEEDMYDAVTAAAFGCVVLRLPKGPIYFIITL